MHQWPVGKLLAHMQAGTPLAGLVKPFHVSRLPSKGRVSTVVGPGCISKLTKWSQQREARNGLEDGEVGLSADHL
jgi:hypothetical protein